MDDGFWVLMFFVGFTIGSFMFFQIGNADFDPSKYAPSEFNKTVCFEREIGADLIKKCYKVVETKAPQ